MDEVRLGNLLTADVASLVEKCELDLLDRRLRAGRP